MEIIRQVRGRRRPQRHKQQLPVSNSIMVSAESNLSQLLGSVEIYDHTGHNWQCNRESSSAAFCLKLICLDNNRFWEELKFFCDRFVHSRAIFVPWGTFTAAISLSDLDCMCHQPYKSHTYFLWLCVYAESGKQ